MKLRYLVAGLIFITAGCGSNETKPEVDYQTKTLAAVMGAFSTASNEYPITTTIEYTASGFNVFSSAQLTLESRTSGQIYTAQRTSFMNSDDINNPLWKIMTVDFVISPPPPSGDYNLTQTMSRDGMSVSNHTIHTIP